MERYCGRPHRSIIGAPRFDLVFAFSQQVDSAKQRGFGKPETFDFLGMTFICSKSRAGRFLIKRKTRRDRMRAKVKEVAEELRRRRHQSIPEQGKWLRQVVAGFFNYHAVPTNVAASGAFRSEIIERWRRTLSRRSEKGALTWARMKKLADDWLPKPRILHPWPNQRFAEVGAGCIEVHVRICAGCALQAR